MKISRRVALYHLQSAVVIIAVSTTALVAKAKDSRGFEQALAEITQGQTIIQDRVEIVSDRIVKEGEHLQVTIELAPSKEPKDEIVELNLLINKGPWPKAFSAKLQSRGGKASFTTRLRLGESCTMHAIAEIDGEALFGATQEVKVSAGAYSR